MEQCSICLESLDGGVVALACNHRFHAACLAQMAGAVGTATTRRGWFESQRDAAKAFGVTTSDVSRLVKDPASTPLRETFEARPALPKKRKRPRKAKAGAAPGERAKCVEGAEQKVNGKWINSHMFPGREFDDLDEYRAAKKQRAARRDEYRAQRYNCCH